MAIGNQSGIPQGTNYREDAWNMVNQKYMDSEDWSNEAYTMLEGFIAAITTAIGNFTFDDILAEIDSLVGVNGSGLYTFTAFSDAFHTLFVATVTSDLTSSAAGLPATWEQAMYDRANARNELELTRIYNEATAFFTSRGWDLPTGANSAKITEINAEIARNRIELNNAILVIGGELRSKFALGIRQVAAQIDTLLISLNKLLNESNLQASLAVKDLLLKRIDIVLQNAIRVFVASLDGLEGNAKIAAQIVASALNGINVSANYGFQGSVSSGHTYDETKDVIEEKIDVSVYYDMTGGTVEIPVVP